jgi:hypothetical protein
MPSIALATEGIKKPPETIPAVFSCPSPPFSRSLFDHYLRQPFTPA